MDNGIALDKFYVYRGLNNDESWGAIIITNGLGKLPNISFGMRVFAKNEKEAIAKAKVTYDKIHVYDSDKENVRRFAAACLKYFIGRRDEPQECAENVMRYSITLLEEYNNYFNELEKDNENE